MYAQCRHKNGITKKSYCCYKLLDEKSFYVSNILNKILIIFTFTHVAYVSKVELFHTSYIKRLLRCNFSNKDTHTKSSNLPQLIQFPNGVCNNCVQLRGINWNLNDFCVSVILPDILLITYELFFKRTNVISIPMSNNIFVRASREKTSKLKERLFVCFYFFKQKKNMWIMYILKTCSIKKLQNTVSDDLCR